MKIKSFYITIIIIFTQLIAVADANYKDFKNDYSLVERQFEQGQSFSVFMQKIYLYSGRGSFNKQTEKYVLVDDEDFEWLNQWKWGLMKLYHCNNPITYARRYTWFNGKYTAILMHRIVLCIFKKDEHGDHISGNTMDNRKCNLRKSTHTQNMQNRAKLTKVSCSWYQGVSYKESKKRWVACISVDKKQKQTFCDSELNAAREYNRMAILYRGEFARINILP